MGSSSKTLLAVRRRYVDPSDRNAKPSIKREQHPATSWSNMVCKVDSIADKYGLTTLDAELKSLRNEGSSLRELETEINHRILRQAFLNGGQDLLPGEVENIYRLLMNDDVSSGTDVQIQDRLNQADIDPQTLTADFVSYQTVRTHLRSCLGVETSDENELSAEAERETLFSLAGRTERVATDTIERLRSADIFEIGTINVSVTIQVSCTDCNRSYPLATFFDERSCECDS